MVSEPPYLTSMFWLMTNVEESMTAGFVWKLSALADVVWVVRPESEYIVMD